jgi:hypothetical protein
MKKPTRTLAALVLLGTAAFVLCSTLGGKVPPHATASPSSHSAEVELAAQVAPVPDQKAAPAGEAALTDERAATRERPESRSVTSRDAPETAHLIRTVSAAPAPPPMPPARAPAPRAPAPEPSGFATGQFRDMAGPSFALTRVTCLIDGKPVYAGRGGKSFELFQRTLPPGNHTVTVQADYLIQSSGVFSYTKGLRFKVFSGRRFNVGAGRPIRISVVGYEKGGPTRDFDERLALAIRTS